VFTIALVDGRISIRSDCNRCVGAATVADASLEVGLLACTRAFCPSSPVDNQFEAAIQGRHTVLVNDARLTLSSERAVLTFVR
jgi:heat shock protein HslJ